MDRQTRLIVDTDMSKRLLIPKEILKDLLAAADCKVGRSQKRDFVQLSMK